MGEPRQPPQDNHNKDHTAQDKKPGGDNFIGAIHGSRERIKACCIHGGFVSFKINHANSHKLAR